MRLLDYPAEDVIDLIKGLSDHNMRYNKDKENETTIGRTTGNIRRKAGDDWF